ncbi:hypothetical protein TL16_g12437 [Triparma laevis f. inornata]|uniref:Uncharacterized protein n=1 Tax=Triparma laevis f. inornata TaxID=1714386 RepID=A0A9W7EWF3_9STRA|nr:hypothetical protein TL16_g12437 [Triparma laevis f. inornata]
MSAPVLSWLFNAMGKCSKLQPLGPPKDSQTSPQREPQSDPAVQDQSQDSHAQPSEPILFPRLRIYFADFPYLHCSID